MSDVSEKSGVTGDNTTQPFKSILSAKSFVPLDVLVTGGKISISLYEYQNDNKRITISALKPYETESDKGYEASEEGSSDEKVIIKQFKPLICITLTTPNAFLSDTQIGRKMQISCFDVSIKISSQNHKIIKNIPTDEDFSINLLETKSGEPNPDTGILPAFFTLKWSKGIGKPATLDIDIAKPTKILFSISRWLYLLQIYDTILDNFKFSLNSIYKKTNEVKVKKVELHLSATSKSNDHYSKFKEIKDNFIGLTILNINFAQTILTIQTSDAIELNISFAKFFSHLTITNRPEKLINTVIFECVSVGVSQENETRLILNPWTVSFEITLFWESWQHVNSNPQIQISIESDCFILDLSPDKILYLQELFAELNDFMSNFRKHEKSYKSTSKVETFKVPIGEKEQHYKDDLRAGAFQFVDAANNNIDELPLPYQVMFWNRNVSAMAWRYPQPRALTKVRIFPVPFKMTTENEEEQQVLCHLEYWSECHGCYQPYTQFYLSEVEMCHLELPKNQPQPAVACTWRVLLTTPNTKEFNNYRIMISPRALAGCIRVDSYFNKNLIPDLTVACHLGTININLFNYFDKNKPHNSPQELRNFTHNIFLPDYQQFLTLSIENANAYLATWKFEMLIFDVSSTIKSTILDYGYLTQQMLIEPFTAKLEVSVSKSLGVNFISKPIHVMFGACSAHTLAVSAQMWSQYLIKSKSEEPNDLIIMTQYVICNDTNISLRFGQAGLEAILLPPRFCHLYAWRSQKCKQMIRVALKESRWVWSEPFRIDQDGTEMYKIPDETTMIVVTIKSLSATQKQVIFSGQFVLCNMLLEHFELKIFEGAGKDKDREFKIAQSHIVEGKSTPPSMLIDTTKAYFMRLRFFGLESAWTGDIPLAENAKCAQPWLVKVPLQERGQFLSIWCRIVVQNFQKGSKILAMLWPLFIIRSNLPITAKVHIETPTLNVHLESTIRGLGEYQQLYCPGTIDHSHQLTFQLDNNTTPTNPYVPLNYSLVDQKVFFKKSEGEDINEILEIINNYDKEQWEYFKDDLENVDFIVDEQPLTHVQVRYQNACLHSSALLVELLPWALLVNMFGCSIALIINEKELCRISHHGIVTPPKLEETFYIGVGICGTWNMSQPLQLAKSNWSQTFYMPQISGTVPLEGSIKTVVSCNPYVSVLSISSNIVNEIRLLKVNSSHVITSHLSIQLHVVSFAVPMDHVNSQLPRHFEKHAFILPPYLNKSRCGIPIIQWLALGSYEESNASLALYITFSARNQWSCPIRVDKGFNRRSIALQADDCSVPIVIVAQESKGQIYLSIHHDFHPQLLIENRSGNKIYCAQINEENVVLKDSEHFNWLCQIDDSRSAYYTMTTVDDKFPELPISNMPECLVLASASENDPQEFLWSTPIVVSSFNDQFVRIPFYGDVKVSVKYSVHTTNIIIESVSQVEISARDIRVRLSLHENEQYNTSNKMEVARKNDPRMDGRDGSNTTIGSTYFSAEESVSSTSTDMTSYEKFHPNFDVLPILVESSYNQIASNQNVNYHVAQFDGLRVLIFIKCITITLTSDLENGGVEKVEISSLTCDNISISLTNADISHISLSVSDIQLDNQLYTRGSYDFPVILVGQENRQNTTLKTLNVPIAQLVHQAQEGCLIKVDLTIETWRDIILNKTITDVRDIKMKVESMSLYIEDIYIMKLIDYLTILQPSKLVLWNKTAVVPNYKLSSVYVPVPAHLICGASILTRPLSLRSFSIEPVSLLLSVHASIKIYLALDQSPLQFGGFDKKRLFTTHYRLGHALTMHYLSGAIFGAGWVVGSLELLGSPGGLARAMGSGLRDFVSLPYHGLVQGPWAFLRGVSYGSASLMKHITAGTLQSVTKLASSVARNLDRLTLDEEHLKRTEESRRQRPQGLTQGFMQGLTGLGISLLGAVGGIAHHPLQSVMMEGATPKSLVAGVGKGIVGVITKPLSGAAELVALTGQGLLQGAGWNNYVEPRMNPVINHVYSNANSPLKYKWKFTQSVTQSNILFVTEATAITNISQYDAVALVLTTEALIIVDIDEDMSQRVLSLSELTGITNNDPTLLCLKLNPPPIVQKAVEDEVVEMDPACRARVADYVRSTVGLMQLPDTLSPEHSEMSISPDETPTSSPNGGNTSDTLLTFYVNPQSRNYFLCLLELAKQQSLNYNFPVL